MIFGMMILSFIGILLPSSNPHAREICPPICIERPGLPPLCTEQVCPPPPNVVRPDKPGQGAG